MGGLACPHARTPVPLSLPVAGAAAAKPKRKLVPQSVCTSVIDGLKNIYFSRIRRIEDDFKFGSFFAPLLNEGDFEAKPNVLLLGQVRASCQQPSVQLAHPLRGRGCWG